MAWVCSICSTSNTDGSSSCIVCGTECSGKHVNMEIEPEDNKVVFSDFEAFKDSAKRFFAKLSSKKTKREKDVKSEKKKRARPKKTIAEGHKVIEKPRLRVARSLMSGSAFATAWPEHKIEFDAATIESKGFVKSERECLNGVNGYRFYKADDTSQFIRAEMLIIQKMAHKV